MGLRLHETAVALAILFALFACGDSSPGDASSGPVGDAGSALVLWTCYDASVHDAGANPSDPLVAYCAPENESPTKACGVPKLKCTIKRVGKDVFHPDAGDSQQPWLCDASAALCEHGPG